MRDVIEIETNRLKLRRLRMSDAQRIACSATIRASGAISL